jgi:hypothetical protein
MVRAVDPDVIKLAVGLAIFFWLFAAVFGLLEETWWMLWAYWLLLLNRLSGLGFPSLLRSRLACDLP